MGERPAVVTGPKAIANPSSESRAIRVYTSSAP